MTDLLDLRHHRRSSARRRTTVAAFAAFALVFAACGSDDGGADGPADSGAVGAKISVVAQFYPLVFAAERVGGEHLDVTSLTPPGVEPHDLELTPRDTAALHDASLVVYLDGFSAAVDEAVAGVDAAQRFDVGPAARLDIESSHQDEDGHDEETHDEETHDEDGHDEDGHDDHDDHDHGDTDPHFWLDPTRLADVADSLAEHFADIDADHADAFVANADELRAELEALDDEFATALANCDSTDLVTSHTAFAYLAQRYGMTQLGITGISPDEEPTPQALAEVIHFVEDHDVTTIYSETLVDPATAETVAAETGAATAVLDPLEGLTAESDGDDYLEVMRSNLATLRDGQRCP